MRRQLGDDEGAGRGLRTLERLRRQDEPVAIAARCRKLRPIAVPTK